jgi:hypothetical protein
MTRVMKRWRCGGEARSCTAPDVPRVCLFLETRKHADSIHTCTHFSLSYTLFSLKSGQIPVHGPKACPDSSEDGVGRCSSAVVCSCAPDQLKAPSSELRALGSGLWALDLYLSQLSNPTILISGIAAPVAFATMYAITSDVPSATRS